MPVDAAQISFVFFGDSGSGDASQLAVAAAVKAWCAAHTCNFVALLGDNFYPDGVSSVTDPQWTSSFEGPYADLGLVFRPSLGNHDHAGQPGAQIAYRSAAWSMPAATYVYREGPVDFVVLDTEKYNKKQRRWLKKALKKSKAPWRIVYGHHPIVSYGGHGINEALQTTLQPVLVDGRVDFYLAAHDHDKQVIAGEPTMVVLGTGGSATRPVKEGPGTLYSGNSLGFGYLAIDGDKAVLQIVDVNGKVEYERAWERKAR